MFLFFFLFWIKYLLVWKYCDKKDMLILYKTWEQHMYVVNNSIKFDKFVPSLFHPNVTLQLECKRTMRTDKIKLKNNIL